MTFPSVELKFTQIQRNGHETNLLVRLYRVDDGGLDAKGNPKYLRTLKRVRKLVVAAGVTKAQILAEAQQRLSEWAIEEGFNVTPDRLLCSL